MGRSRRIRHPSGTPLMRARTFRRRIAGLAWLCLPGVLGAQGQRAVLIRTDRATGRQQLERRIPRNGRRGSGAGRGATLARSARRPGPARHRPAADGGAGCGEPRPPAGGGRQARQPAGDLAAAGSGAVVRLHPWCHVGCHRGGVGRERRSSDRTLYRCLAPGRDRHGEDVATRGDHVHRHHPGWCGTRRRGASTRAATAQAGRRHRAIRVIRPRLRAAGR